MVNQNSTQPNLTTLTRWGRLTVKYGAVVLVGFLILRMLVISGWNYWQTVNPPPPPPPTVGFGVLPPINFPRSSQTPESYQLETATGGFPNFPDRAKVFLMPKASASLLDDQNAKKIAANFDFVFEPEVLDAQTYRFTKNTPLNATLDLNIIHHVFKFSTDYLNRPDLTINNNLPTNFDAANLAKTFVDLAQNLEKDISTASAQITYLKSSGGKMISALSASDADFVRVDLNRVPIDGLYSMYTQKGKIGVVSVIISGFFSGEKSIVDAQNFYYPVDYETVQTYPLRAVKNAWKSLQAGEGLVIDAGKNSTAVIREVSLGYYDDLGGEEYLQPVYVFSGDDGFLALTPAIDPKYVQSTIEN